MAIGGSTNAIVHLTASPALGSIRLIGSTSCPTRRRCSSSQADGQHIHVRPERRGGSARCCASSSRCCSGLHDGDGETLGQRLATEPPWGRSRGRPAARRPYQTVVASPRCSAARAERPRSSSGPPRIRSCSSARAAPSCSLARRSRRADRRARPDVTPTIFWFFKRRPKARGDARGRLPPDPVEARAGGVKDMVRSRTRGLAARPTATIVPTSRRGGGRRPSPSCATAIASG